MSRGFFDNFMRERKPNGRFLIVRNGCPYCSKVKKILPKINMRLPFNKRIRIVNNTNTELFGIKSNFIQNKIRDENFTGYPIIYYEGSMILGAEESKYMYYRLLKLVEEYLIY